MNHSSYLTPLILATVLLVSKTAAPAAEQGFTPLLDRDHADGWRQCGKGGLRLKDGVGTTWYPNEKGAFGVAWFTRRTFGDFVLKVEFKGDASQFNAGIRLRFPDPGDNPGNVTSQGYEVAIASQSTKDNGTYPTGSIYGFQRASAIAQRETDWNEFEITAVGHRYTVKLNGVLVNEFIGNRLLSGYVGIENHRVGPVQFRNLRIKDLTGAPVVPVTLATVQSDPDQPRIEVLKDQGLNAMEWALAPLDEGIPQDIRQNIASLREDLLDEGKKAPKAAIAAYTLGHQLCDKLLLTIEERNQARAQAGYAAAQADAAVQVTSQALEARRNSMMSWPQFSREQSQRAELERRQRSGADLKKERSDLQWTARTELLRKHLDDLYRQFRESLR